MNLRNSFIILIAAFAPILEANDELNTTATSKVMKIVEESYQACYYPGDDAQRKARMMIVDAQGNKQLRQFNIFKKDKEDGGDQDFLVVFEKPSDVKNTVLLVNKHAKAEDDRWLYLPGLDLDKRIASSDKRTSFVGSNYFYEDISGRNLQLDNFELITESENAYQIKAIPKNPAAVEFDYYEMLIDKKTMLPMVMEYFKNNNLIRKAEILEVEEVDGYPTVLKSKITDLRNNSHTLVQFRKPNYDIGLKQDLFTERSLRNPPKKLFK